MRYHGNHDEQPATVYVAQSMFHVHCPQVTEFCCDSFSDLRRVEETSVHCALPLPPAMSNRDKRINAFVNTYKETRKIFSNNASQLVKLKLCFKEKVRYEALLFSGCCSCLLRSIPCCACF